MDFVIRKVSDEFEEYAAVIRNSFITVAEEFGLTRENAPTNPAFLGAESLMAMKDKGTEMFGAYLDGRCVGFVALENAENGVFYMERLGVLPEYRHNGVGKEMMDFVFGRAKEKGGSKVSIGIVNENGRLKDWYIKYGFVETGIKTFSHLPFTVCFMEKLLSA